MGACIAYGVILEEEDHEKVLSKILVNLPEEELHSLYSDFYGDEYEYRAYLAKEKHAPDALDIESPEFKEEAFAMLIDGDAISDYIRERYPYLSVSTIRYGEVSSIIIRKSHQFLEEYGPIGRETFSKKKMKQLNAALTELELDLTPEWFYWRY